jgi:hypothetical protein
MKFCSIAMQLIISFLLASISLPTFAQEIERGEPVKGQYINNDYGFTVKIPAGMTGYLPPQPAIEHGFVLEISKTDKVFAWVQGTTIPTGEKELGEVLADHLYYLGSEKKARVVRKIPVELLLEIPVEDATKPKIAGQVVPVRKAKLAALRAFIEIEDLSGGEKMTQDLIVAVFKQREGFNAVYFIALQTPKSKHEKYSHIVDDLQRDFKVFKMYE